MLPSQFNKLLELLRIQLGAIHEAIKNQESAIRNSAEAAKEKWRELPGVIATSILGTTEDKKSAEAQKVTTNDQQERLISSQGKLVFWTRFAFVAAAIAAGAAIYYAHIASKQLEQMKAATDASTRSVAVAILTLGENQLQFEKTLKVMQDQTGIQGKAAIGTQRAAVAAGIGANAAQGAANTAKETLHVSERAYVLVEDPTLDFTLKAISLPLVNSGHIPSGPAISIIHEATYNVANLTMSAPLDAPDQKSWQHNSWSSVLPGNHQSVGIPVPLLDQKLSDQGLQLVMVAGSISYNDGFPETPNQTWKFCFRTVHQITMKKTFIIICDPDQMIPKLEKADGYPNNENPQ